MSRVPEQLIDHIAVLEHVQIYGAHVEPEREGLRTAGTDLHGQQRRQGRVVLPDEAVCKNELCAGDIIVIERIALHVNTLPACLQLV